MALQRALDLHRRVPPERWCLQKTEFDDFVDMVYEAWCSHRIPNLPIHSNQSNSLHEDPKHGPNLYVVNTSLVKPLTLAAGGASYALIKHPEGLKCEVFVSHSWDGGIFHLRRKIHIAWPQLHQLQNLYCCLLSNPQNLDLDEFIGGNLLQSAFALALQRATHLLVVPNPSVGVYSRLWCVYEAYLGAKWKKIYLLPVRPRARETCKYWFSSVGKYLLVGCVFGSITFISLKLFVGQERGIYSWLALIYRISSVAVLLVVVPYRHASWSLCMMTFASWFGCAFVLVDVVWASETLKQSGGQDWAPLVLHYGWFTNLTFINVLVTVLLAILKGETAGFEEQRSMMQFESLYTSHCSNPTDEQRIREAITGAEKEVETVIRVLLAAGAYTDNLRLAHDSGLDIDRDGMTDVKTGLLLGVVFWMTSTLDLFADIHICHSDYQTSMSVLCCLYGLTLLLVPIFVARLEENGPDAAVFAVKAWGFWGMFSLSTPIILCYLQGYDEAANLWMPCFFNGSYLASIDTDAWRDQNGIYSFNIPITCTILASRFLVLLLAWASLGMNVKRYFYIRIWFRSVCSAMSFKNDSAGECHALLEDVTGTFVVNSSDSETSETSTNSSWS